MIKFKVVSKVQKRKQKHRILLLFFRVGDDIWMIVLFGFYFETNALLLFAVINKELSVSVCTTYCFYVRFCRRGCQKIKLKPPHYNLIEKSGAV